MGDVDVFVDGKVRVRAEQCSNCLLSKDRLVDGARAREIIRTTGAQDGASFVCHKGQLPEADEPDSICASWWDLYSDRDWILRWAKSLGIVERVG